MFTTVQLCPLRLICFVHFFAFVPHKLPMQFRFYIAQPKVAFAGVEGKRYVSRTPFHNRIILQFASLLTLFVNEYACLCGTKHEILQRQSVALPGIRVRVLHANWLQKNL